MRDYGIQVGLLIEQGTWIVKVEFVVLRVYIFEKEVFVYFNGEGMWDEEEEYEMEEEDGEEDYSEVDGDDEVYSSIQKENRFFGGFLDVDENGNLFFRKGRRRNVKYICKFCRKGFQWYFYLTLYERIYIGEKLFKCFECFRVFIRVDGL